MDDSSATRHLSAGAYLDADFRRRSLREVYQQAKRVVAPSYGYDVIPVLWHCLRARNIAIIRDSVIVGVLVVAACAFFPAALAAVALLIVIRLITSTWTFMRDSFRILRSGGSIPLRTFAVRAVTVLFGLALGGAALFVVVGLLAGSIGLALGQALLAGDTSTITIGENIGLLVIFFVFAVPIGANLVRQIELERLAPGRKRATPGPSARFDDISRQQSGNTVVYADYWPFVGSGVELATWNFAQRLVRPDRAFGSPTHEAEREFDLPPFTAEELVRYIVNQLEPLRNHPEPERRLPGLVVADRIFQAGTEVSHLATQTPAGDVADIIRNPTAPTRHYLMCQVVSWHGELVTSVYVHVAVQGKTLYIEFTSTALPPCDERFRVMDKVGGTGPVAFLRAIWRGFVDTPQTVGSAPINLVRAAFDAIVASVDLSRPQAVVARGFDYGATVSVRELGSAELRNHIQTSDILKYSRLIERRVLAAVLDFLEIKGVDTIEYRNRAANVLNAGVVNNGSGNVNVMGDAVGQSNVGTPAAPAPAPAGGVR